MVLVFVFVPLKLGCVANSGGGERGEDRSTGNCWSGFMRICEVRRTDYKVRGLQM